MAESIPVLEQLIKENYTYKEIAHMTGLTYDQVAGRAKNYGITKKVVKSKGNIEYHDMKGLNTEEDMESYLEKLIELQSIKQKMDRKQLEASIEINDEKPIGIAVTGDWHLGHEGVDYKQFIKDIDLICNTEGLYSLGAGDYKDNYVYGSPGSGGFEAIANPGYQDNLALHFMKKLKNSMLAIVRGCHDDWDYKTSSRDFTDECAKLAECINLWHGGIIHIKLGNVIYKINLRHKYKYNSNLNPTNTHKRMADMMGFSDIFIQGHLHHSNLEVLKKQAEDMYFIRSGSYKVLEEFGQKIGGYKGEISVPVLILFPDKKKILVFKYLEDGIEALNHYRNKK